MSSLIKRIPEETLRTIFTYCLAQAGSPKAAEETRKSILKAFPDESRWQRAANASKVKDSTEPQENHEGDAEEFDDEGEESEDDEEEEASDEDGEGNYSESGDVEEYDYEGEYENGDGEYYYEPEPDPEPEYVRPQPSIARKLGISGPLASFIDYGDGTYEDCFGYDSDGYY
ncbi:hypothetical protein VNI00_009969 [Paramarasmius palmivorus]|uniref:Uncharacterized protein n=1 Tax=Paramarasmius palmivorus TaxID=297713 RepID=A0AAW0CK27_9AGAR